MEVSDKTRRRIRLQDGLFYVLFLTAVGLAAWLSTRYDFEADWTASGRNTPAPQTLAVLEKLEGPVHITAFVTAANEPLRREIQRLVARYQRYRKDIQLTFVNPDRDPAKAREMGITFDGQMVVSYQGRQEKLTQPSEQALTNALQRLVRSGERWLVFVQGHGERDPTGTAPFDLARLAAQLRDKGIRVRRLNLGKELAIPDNTAVLVIASPQRDYLPGEVKLIQDYLNQGGNLLWLVEPGADHGLLPMPRSWASATPVSPSSPTIRPTPSPATSPPSPCSPRRAPWTANRWRTGMPAPFWKPCRVAGWKRESWPARSVWTPARTSPGR